MSIGSWQTDDWREVRLLKIQDHHNFTFYGQSVAGTRTCIVVEELNIVFDFGFFPRKAATCDVILISHGHADHIGALHIHALDRRMNHMDIPTYVMPKVCVAHFNQAFQAFKNINHHIDDCDIPVDSSPYKIIGSDPSDTINQMVIRLPKAGGKYHVKSYAMIHCVPAIGYVIFETRKKLRSDLRAKLISGELLQSDIGRLVKSGEEVNDVTEVPLIAFSGDTTIEGLLRHTDMLNAETLIIECTYLLANLDESKNDTPEECHRRGHIHEQDIIDNHDKFKCKELILCHFSRKYRREDIFATKERLQKLFSDRILINVFQD